MKAHEWEQIGQELAGEMRADTEIVSRELFSQPLPDSERLTEAQMIERTRSNWADPAFRSRLLIQLGAQNFVALAHKAFGVDGRLKLQEGAIDG